MNLLDVFLYANCAILAREFIPWTLIEAVLRVREETDSLSSGYVTQRLRRAAVAWSVSQPPNRREVNTREVRFGWESPPIGITGSRETRVFRD